MALASRYAIGTRMRNIPMESGTICGMHLLSWMLVWKTIGLLFTVIPGFEASRVKSSAYFAVEKVPGRIHAKHFDNRMLERETSRTRSVANVWG